MSFLFIQTETAGKMSDLYRGDVFDANRDLRASLKPAPSGIDSNYSRAIALTGDLDSFWKLNPILSNDSAVIWIHFHFLELYNNGCGLKFFSSTGSLTFELFHSSGNFLLYDEKTSSSEIGRASNVIGLGGEEVDFDVKLDLGTGDWKIWKNGIETASGTNSRISNYTASDLALIYPRGSSVNAITECIITENKPTIGMRAITLNPDALGTENDMTGNLSDVNSLVLTEAAMVTETGGTQTFSYGDIPAGIDLSRMAVKAVKVGSVVSSTENSETDYVQNVLKSGSTVLPLEGGYASNTLSNTFETQTTMEINPATGQPWSFTEINNLELGVKFDISPVASIIVGYSGSSYGYQESVVGEAEIIDASRGITTMGRFSGIVSNNLIDLEFGGSKIDGKDTVSVTMRADSGEEKTITMAWASVSYQVTDPTTVTWLQGKVNRRVYIYVAK